MLVITVKDYLTLDDDDDDDDKGDDDDDDVNFRYVCREIYSLNINKIYLVKVLVTNTKVNAKMVSKKNCGLILLVMREDQKQEKFMIMFLTVMGQVIFFEGQSMIQC